MAIDPSESDVWDGLPRMSRRELSLERRVEAWSRGDRVRQAFAWLTRHGLSATFDRPEVESRPSAVGRPAVVAQIRWPRLRTRLAIGVETAAAHAVVDRLLGYERPFAANRLQTTPVEWGVWTYLITRAIEEIDRADASPFRFGGRPEEDALDLSIDRVGPSSFDVEGLGEIITIRWAIRLGRVAGAVRLWLPASLANYWVDESAAPARRSIPPGAVETASEWRSVLGTSPWPMGLARLRVGAVLPILGARIGGEAADPTGELDLACASTGEEYRLPVELEPGSAGRRVRVAGPLSRHPRPPGEPAMSKSPTPIIDPLDAPVTLTIELGRVTIPLGKLADLKPGEVLELGRHSREPVEITSNGRVVARGDLILIDTELGVRVTSVFL